ncbi:MAG: fibronectin type III domain-containing protein [Bacillota bacterium]|jgi:hypothetical protein
MICKRNKTKILGLFTALVLVAGLFAALGLNGAFAGTLNITSPDNVLLYPCNNSAEMSVTWWDAETVGSGQVVYGVQADLTDGKTANAEVTADTENGYASFEAKMTGLTAGTKYYYKVGHDNTWSRIYSFTTEPENAEAFNFLYLGDVQYVDKTNAQNEYNEWADLVTKAVSANDFAFALMGGDMVQEESSVTNWNMFLNSAGKNFASLPMLAVTGNHETNGQTGMPENMTEYLALPTNGPEGFAERFYSYDYGSCHIVVLDSNVFSGEAELTAEDLAKIKNWFAEDLANSDAVWKIVAMHHPAYAVVTDKIADQVMENWVEVFEDAQVDLVLCGHQHIYMRTHPMYQGKLNQKGITYVMGNSGSKYYSKADVFYSAKMIENTSTYQAVSIDGDKLTLNTCGADGTVLDTVTLNARNRDIPIPDIEEVAGDVDGDGYVTAADYDIIIKAILNCTTNSFMDVNADGKVNIADAHYVKIKINAAAGNN